MRIRIYIRKALKHASGAQRELLNEKIKILTTQLIG
jgi:hypothetical protein